MTFVDDVSLCIPPTLLLEDVLAAPMNAFQKKKVPRRAVPPERRNKANGASLRFDLSRVSQLDLFPWRKKRRGEVDAVVAYNDSCDSMVVENLARMNLLVENTTAPMNALVEVSLLQCDFPPMYAKLEVIRLNRRKRLEKKQRMSQIHLEHLLPLRIIPIPDIKVMATTVGCEIPPLIILFPPSSPQKEDVALHYRNVNDPTRTPVMVFDPPPDSNFANDTIRDDDTNIEVVEQFPMRMDPSWGCCTNPPSSSSWLLLATLLLCNVDS